MAVHIVADLAAAFERKKIQKKILLKKKKKSPLLIFFFGKNIILHFFFNVMILTYRKTMPSSKNMMSSWEQAVQCFNRNHVL